MNKTVTVALALFAGLLGGMLTRYITPPAAFAQDRVPIAEIRAQSFTLVDASDRTVGTFTIEPMPGAHVRGTFRGNEFMPDPNVPMRIVLRDPMGGLVWSPMGRLIPLSER